MHESEINIFFFLKKNNNNKKQTIIKQKQKQNIPRGRGRDGAERDNIFGLFPHI